MGKKKQQLFDEVNRAIIKFRGTYSEWSTRHGISYNEMLVLYSIREAGYCTQKQICENYLLPKQTINNVIIAIKVINLYFLYPINYPKISLPQTTIIYK